MEENLHNKDKLERFFQKSFEDQNNPPEMDGWDLPSDHVWDGIDATINEEKDRKPKIVLWKWLAIAASFLIFVMAYQIINWNNKFDAITNELKQNRNAIEKIEENVVEQSAKIEEQLVESKKEKTIEKENLDTEKSKQEIVNTTSSNSKNQSTIFESEEKKSSYGNHQFEENKNKKLNFSSSNKETKNTAENNLKKESDAQDKNTSNLKNESTLLNNEEIVAVDKEKKEVLNQKPNSIKMPLQTLNSKEVQLVSMNKKMPSAIFPSMTPIEPITKIAQQNKFSIGIFGGPTYTYRSVSARPKHPKGPMRKDLLNNSEKGAYSANLGISLGYHINQHLSIETGVEYTKTSLENRQLVELPFSHANEHTNQDGELETDYSYSLPTSYGDVETEITLARSTSTSISENDKIKFSMLSKLDLYFIKVPLVAKYRFSKKALSLTAKAGVSANFLVKRDLEISAGNPQRVGFRSKSIKNNKPRKDIKTTNLHYVLGLGLEYKLNKNLRLSIEPSFSKSFTPVVLKEETKTYPMAASLNVGLSYHF